MAINIQISAEYVNRILDLGCLSSVVCLVAQEILDDNSEDVGEISIVQ